MSNQEKKPEEGLIDITEYIADYFRIARRMWAWFLIFILIGAGLFYIKARLSYTPVYTASATFTVNMSQDETLGNSTSTFFNNSTAEQMATTFPHILTSGVLRRKVEEDLGPAAASSSISASVLENTNLLTIAVTDRDADRAYAVLQSVVENYPSISEVIVGKTHMEILDETGIPAYPDNPKAFTKSAVKGAIFGMALVAAWVILLMFTRRTIRKEEDIYQRIHSRCLGTIPSISKKRRTKELELPRFLVMEPKYEDLLQENLRIIRNKIEYHANEYEHKVFLITSAAAGEGKTMISANLALTLARAGHKVTLIDCDLRHPSGRDIFGLEKGQGLVDVLNKKAKTKDCMLKPADLDLDENLKFLFFPGGESVEDGSELLGSHTMQKIIGSARQWADYVILDGAPAGLITDSVVLAQYADAAIFAVRKDFSRVDDILDGMEHLAESHVQMIGCILNGV